MNAWAETRGKTALDFRLYIELVAAISDGSIQTLCERWKVEPAMEEYPHPLDNEPILDFGETVYRLAKHAVEYHRKEWELEEASE